MFFEGSEKKAEIIVDRSKLSLLTAFDDEFWLELVVSCQAKIISQINNEHCKAFLLSESSLFVWHDRLVIITCGITQLVNSVTYFLEQVDANVIQHVSYQRKNEYFSHAQASCFGDDIKTLTKYIDGQAYRLGEMDCHHTYIFQQQNHYPVLKNNSTYELLVYQISDAASEFLTSTLLTCQAIRTFLQLDSWLSDYMLDDHLFTPYGYSCNAIKGKDYVTIHITPQAASSYVSIEASINLISLAPMLLKLLKPKSFDLLCCNEGDFEYLMAEFIPNPYIANALVQQQLANNNHVNFAQFMLPATRFKTAEIIDITDPSLAL